MEPEFEAARVRYQSDVGEWAIEFKRQGQGAWNILASTKADLVKDLGKQHGHRSDKIKKLYFAVPDTVLRKNGVLAVIPENAGVLRVWKSEYGGHSCSVEREAMVNTNAKPLTDADQFQVVRLGAMRIWNLKKRLQKIREAMK